MLMKGKVGTAIFWTDFPFHICQRFSISENVLNCSRAFCLWIAVHEVHPLKLFQPNFEIPFNS